MCEEPKIIRSLPCVWESLAQDIRRSVAVRVDHKAAPAAVKASPDPSSGKCRFIRFLSVYRHRILVRDRKTLPAILTDLLEK